MLSTNKKFAVVSLGCKVNRAEVDSYSAKLISQGYEMVDVKNADLVIINTCTVTSVADKKTRQTVRKVCVDTLAKDIIVTGCATAIDAKSYKEMDPRICIVKKKDMMSPDSESLKILSGSDFRCRVALKIQDGCNNACTYCIVHTARGPAWSLPAKIVKEQFSVLIDAGIKEVVLSGVDIGAYRDNDFTLEDLCESLLNIIGDKNVRIRISSIEPNNVSEKLIDIIANAKGKICRHLHIPLQSGSSKVLSEMHRKYSAEQYLQLVNMMRNKIPELALSTDIIVGFPGESKDDFNMSLELAKKCAFMKIHVFPYSKRAGTPAALRTDQINEDEKSARAKNLRDLSDSLARFDLQSRHGLSEFVLVEPNAKARSESYHIVPAPDGTKVGDLILTEL